MEEIQQKISYKETDDIAELPVHLQKLLSKAHEATSKAYAPYSKFKVGAAVLLENGEMISGSNQENASSPAGICAERVALSSASSVFPSVAVTAIAITAAADGYSVSEPVGPCGICRQTILEYEHRFNRDIEIILQGEKGKIFWIPSVKELLPLNFSQSDLGKLV